MLEDAIQSSITRIKRYDVSKSVVVELERVASCVRTRNMYGVRNAISAIRCCSIPGCVYMELAELERVLRRQR